ncbi:MAG: hypothetical protein MUF73_03340 [Rhodobacteraceae bacterium]|jgi:hypothetical protein|nr:hypothetical protein [Paracoccaceae bacterium]
MLGRLFRCQGMRPATSPVIEVRLPVRIAGDKVDPIFAQPLSRALSEAGLGRVAGHRVALNDTGEVVGLGLSVQLVSRAGRALDRVVQELERLDAPRGSVLLIDDRAPPITFGAAEGLGLYLSRAALQAVDDSPTAHLDVVEDCIDALAGLASYQGSAALADRVALYFYGASFNKMSNALAYVLDTNPACRDAETRRLT